MANNIWQFLADGITAFTAAGFLKTKKQAPSQTPVTEKTPPPSVQPEANTAEWAKSEAVPVDKSETLYSSTTKIDPVTLASVKPEPSSLPTSLDETPVIAQEPTATSSGLAGLTASPEIKSLQVTSPEITDSEAPQTPEPQDTAYVTAESSPVVVTTAAIAMETSVPQPVENVAAVAEALPQVIQETLPEAGADGSPEAALALDTEFQGIATLWPSAAQLDPMVRQAWNIDQTRTGTLVQRSTGYEWWYGVALSNQHVMVWEPDQTSESPEKGRLAIYPLTDDYIDAIAVTYLDRHQILQNILRSITAFHQEWVYAEGWNNEHWARLVTTGDPISYQVKEKYEFVGLDRPELYQRPEAQPFLDRSLVNV